MKHKKSKSNNARIRPTRTIAQKDDGFVFVQSRGTQHNRALTRLEKKFGRKDFNLIEAGRAGIDQRLLRELVQFKQVLARPGNCYTINQDASAHALEFETPFPHDCANFAMFENLPDDSPLKKQIMITTSRPTPEEEEAEAEALRREFEPMHVTKRFKMPYSLYLDLRPEIDNLSAYLRFLIYRDRGMEAQAEMERKRMGDSTRES